MAAKGPAARKPRQEEPEKPQNHERYLLTYADMITLLMTFFVVMYAMSQVETTKYTAMSESLMEAFNMPGVQAEEGKGGHSLSPTDSSLKPPPGTGLSPKKESTKNPFSERARSTLKTDINTGAVRVNTEARGIVVALAGDFFFEQGSATLGAGAVPVLTKIAELARDLPNPVVVEGHTDAAPMPRNDRFSSNLMLSAARAVNVAETLELLGLDPARVSAAGYGDSKPARSNDSPEGRAYNRRVEILFQFAAE